MVISFELEGGKTKDSGEGVQLTAPMVRARLPMRHPTTLAVRLWSPKGTPSGEKGPIWWRLGKEDFVVSAGRGEVQPPAVDVLLRRGPPKSVPRRRF